MRDSAQDFNPQDFYADYARQVIERPGYPARAAYKSLLAWRHFGRALLALPGSLYTVADVGGCFGFGLNAFVFHGRRILGHELRGELYEMGQLYAELGQRLFPHLRFRQEDFTQVALEQPYDLTLMFDLLEHVAEPAAFLEATRPRTRFLLVKTPLETSLARERAVAAGRASSLPTGAAHRDGHLHLFKLPDFLALLEPMFEVRQTWVAPAGTWRPPEILSPERLSPKDLRRVSLKERLRPFVEPWYRLLTQAYQRRAVERGLREGDAFLLAQARG